MIKATYEQLVEIIAKSSGFTEEEIKRRVDAKRAKLSGLITKEGAAQVVAAELGVNFDRQKVKVKEILPGMKKISITGKVLEVYPVRKYVRGGIENKVVNLLIADETGSVRIVLWDTNHIKLIENSDIKKDSVVEIKDAVIRNNELHLTNFSKIELSDKKIEAVKKETMHEKKLADLKENESAKVRATIVQLFEPRFFSVCQECNGTVQKEAENFVCTKHGKVVAVQKPILTTIIDDGSANLRAVGFSDVVSALLGETEKIKETDFFLQKKSELLGKEFWFSGRTRKNKMFGNVEFVISSIEDVNPQELIESLEKKE